MPAGSGCCAVAPSVSPLPPPCPMLADETGGATPPEICRAAATLSPAPATVRSKAGEGQWG